jgi:hypothetical protein
LSIWLIIAGEGLLGNGGQARQIGVECEIACILFANVRKIVKTKDIWEGQMDDRVKVIVGVAAVSAIGAGVSLLLSDKGENFVERSRKAIAHKVGRGVDSAASATSETLHNVADKISNTFS